MAKGSGKRGGGDRVLESRHLVGLFLAVVLLCSVFFTLGYVMGRAEYSGSVHASDSARVALPPLPSASARTKVKEQEAAPPPAEWDFYAQKDSNQLEPPAPAPKAVAPRPLSSSSATAKPSPSRVERMPPAPVFHSARFTPPRMLGTAIVLQVAAVRHQGDALAVASALQRKRFPSFVVAPSSDNFYRVQVGPYADERSAESAKSALARAGFKAIIKR